MLSDPLRTTLGPDPVHRTCIVNGNAFQQDAIHSFNGWQYACFYASLPNAEEPLFVHLSRRKLLLNSAEPWETLVFEDYPQTVDDGHNTVQVENHFCSFSLPPFLFKPRGFCKKERRGHSIYVYVRESKQERKSNK